VKEAKERRKRMARGNTVAGAGVLIGVGGLLLAAPWGWWRDRRLPRMILNRWSISTGSGIWFANFKTADGWSGTAPHFEVNYGAISNVQLHLIAPLAYSAPTHGVGTGIWDLELG